MSNAEDEPTLPVAKAKKPKPEAKAPKPKPERLLPGYRDAAQQDRLRRADQAAWELLTKLRFVPPAVLKSLAYENLGFPFSDQAFRARMRHHREKGHWMVKRLGSRPESVLYLTKRGTELIANTYGQSAPKWNPDTARRGWLRSWAWLNLIKVGGTPSTGLEELKSPYAAKAIQAIDASPKTSSSPDGLGIVSLWQQIADGKTPTVTHDYIRLGGAHRVWLLVEDLHKSVESQVEAMRLAHYGLYGSSPPQTPPLFIFRPVDELACWSEGKDGKCKCGAPKLPSPYDACVTCGAPYGQWVRKSGRLVQATRLLEEAGWKTSPMHNCLVPYLQTEP